MPAQVTSAFRRIFTAHPRIHHRPAHHRAHRRRRARARHRRPHRLGEPALVLPAVLRARRRRCEHASSTSSHRRRAVPAHRRRRHDPRARGQRLRRAAQGRSRRPADEQQRRLLAARQDGRHLLRVPAVRHLQARARGRARLYDPGAQGREDGIRAAGDPQGHRLRLAEERPDRIRLRRDRQRSDTLG